MVATLWHSRRVALLPRVSLPGVVRVLSAAQAISTPCMAFLLLRAVQCPSRGVLGSGNANRVTALVVCVRVWCWSGGISAFLCTGCFAVGGVIGLVFMFWGSKGVELAKRAGPRWHFRTLHMIMEGTQ